MKKAYIAVILALVCCLLAGCQSYEDTNGDDTSLQTITDQTIISSTASTVMGFVGSSINGTGTAQAQSLNGVRVLCTLRGGTYTVEALAQVKGGNFKLVLCNKDEILKVFTLGQQDSATVDCSQTVYLKAVGESAQFSVSYSAVKAEQ